MIDLQRFTIQSRAAAAERMTTESDVFEEARSSLIIQN